MKFLHSPSSSTPEIRPNYTTASCFPGVLRRLLCFQTLPTLAFDHRIESYGSNELDELGCDDKPMGNPGIVAKLMGLDSMPAGNSIDDWKESELRKKGYYEAPSFVEFENEKFIILSFEGGGKDKELELGSLKTRKGSIEFKKKTRKKKNQEISQSHENEGEVRNSCEFFYSKSNFDNNSKKLCDIECSTRAKSRKKVETESDSENSSPVSVLEFPDHQEASHSGKEDSNSKNSNSRRKLRGDLDKNAPSPSPRSSCNSMDNGVESSTNGEKVFGLKKKKFVNRNFDKMWEEICKIAEKDVINSSRVQRERWKGEDFEEIGVNFELQILDQLILELFTIT